MLDDGTVAARRDPVRRTPAERAAIVAETYEPGATVAGVARKHGIVASQLSTWRTAAKRKTGQNRFPAFADLSVMVDALSAPFDGIEVVVGGVVIRLSKNTTPKRIADIAQLLARS
jgi:transposase|tara:strand:+ start:82 stop:429 length:348 start_codon:yes stop_codon:yes gene_type:complete